MYNIGEKPGKGSYCCTNCGWQVTLDDEDDRLPPCGSCGKGQNTTYRSADIGSSKTRLVRPPVWPFIIGSGGRPEFCAPQAPNFSRKIRDPQHANSRSIMWRAGKPTVVCRASPKS